MVEITEEEYARWQALINAAVDIARLYDDVGTARTLLNGDVIRPLADAVRRLGSRPKNNFFYHERRGGN